MSKLNAGTDAELLAARRAIDKRDAEIIRRTAVAALTGAGGAVEILTPILCQDAKVVETHRGVDVRFRVGATGWGDVNDAIELLKADSQTRVAFASGKKVIETPVANPWRKGQQWNLTAQMRVRRENPELAARLRAEAEA